MGIPVMILGESGSGKTTSLRNFTPDEIGVIGVVGKPLPFIQRSLSRDPGRHGALCSQCPSMVCRNA